MATFRTSAGTQPNADRPVGKQSLYTTGITFL